MGTNYTIRNFRAFNENGINIELSPITILTGCNSSGKSSVVKSVFLLDSYLSQIKESIKNHRKIVLGEYKLDFTSYPNNLLGRFDKVVNRESSAKSITLEYTVYSLILSKELLVRLTFNGTKGDMLNNGYLSKLEILCNHEDEETVIFKSQSGNGNVYNLECVKSGILDFLLGEYLIHSYCSIIESKYGGDIFGDIISEDEYNKQRELHLQGFKSIGKKRILDITKSIRMSSDRKSVLDIVDCKPTSVEWSQENGSLFNIPFVNKIKDVTKENIEQTIKALLPKEPDEELQCALDKILANFKESEYATFGEYFKYKESTYLSKIDAGIYQGTVISDGDYNNAHLPNTNDFKVWRSYLLWLGSIPTDVIGENNVVHHYSEKEREDIRKKTMDSFLQRPTTFNLLYEAVMLLNNLCFGAENEDFRVHDLIYDEIYSHKLYDAVVKAFENIIIDALTPSWSASLSYVSSSRVAVKRLYTLDLNDDFTNLLKKYSDAKRMFLKDERDERKRLKREYEPNTFMNRWVKLFGIGEAISISTDDEGLGVQIRLQKTPGGESNLLADEGYGITQLFSILLQIETAILSAREPSTNNYWGLSDLDLYDIMEYHYPLQTIAIEEPEIHLHPKYQSLLADLFNEAYVKYNIHFIIETHSEYLIRKEQVLVADEKAEAHVANDKISIVYIDTDEDTHKPKAKYIGICKDGYLDDSFGSGFFDEATSLSRKLL